MPSESAPSDPVLKSRTARAEWRVLKGAVQTFGAHLTLEDRTTNALPLLRLDHGEGILFSNIVNPITNRYDIFMRCRAHLVS